MWDISAIYCSKETIPKLSDLNNRDLLQLIIGRGGWVLLCWCCPSSRVRLEDRLGLEAGLTQEPEPEPGRGCGCARHLRSLPPLIPRQAGPASLQGSWRLWRPGWRTLTVPLGHILCVKEATGQPVFRDRGGDTFHFLIGGAAKSVWPYLICDIRRTPSVPEKMSLWP